MLQKVLINNPNMDTTTSLMLYRCGVWKYRHLSLYRNTVEWKLNGWSEPLSLIDHKQITKISYVSSLQNSFIWSARADFDYIFDSFNVASTFR